MQTGQSKNIRQVNLPFDRHHDEGPRVGIYCAPRFGAPGSGVNIGVDGNPDRSELILCRARFQDEEMFGRA